MVVRLRRECFRIPAHVDGFCECECKCLKEKTGGKNAMSYPA